MATMHEWESRVRHLEEVVNRLGDALARAMDQIGQVDQNQRMTRPGAGFGDGGWSISFAVVTTTITAAPAANKAGEGFVTLRTRDNENLADGKTGVKTYNNLSIALPTGKRAVVAVKNGVALLLSGDCP
jgi:hypothetical protein